MHPLIVTIWLALLAPAALAQTAIAPTDVPKHLDETVTVEGPLDEVHTDQRSGTTFLNLGGRYPNQAFTCVIFRDDAAKFPNLDKLLGKVIDITGHTRKYKGRDEMICNDPAQLRAK
jgi:DNA/RNA endonuclease YhcR with UshA esterase domain